MKEIKDDEINIIFSPLMVCQVKIPWIIDSKGNYIEHNCHQIMADREKDRRKS